MRSGKSAVTAAGAETPMAAIHPALASASCSLIDGTSALDIDQISGLACSHHSARRKQGIKRAAQSHSDSPSFAYQSHLNQISGLGEIGEKPRSPPGQPATLGKPPSSGSPAPGALFRQEPSSLPCPPLEVVLHHTHKRLLNPRLLQALELLSHESSLRLR